ncbi:hypothetical protein [Xenorhabdus innexi]|uniref:Uncharacterized protein n=1 Tax=Xenorhabdus innexi TaxID=290109 RepID=A0A1N6MWY5_9GAMM|nr:hypothetical protein [Xenorhabdus innexi]PHM35949.1 hypothetical protein Xinn_02019 [Xenorhabdus innexi]SIP73249.1 hypothetical protein XIS1_1790055 [Xenorhabdus innexi]
MKYNELNIQLPESLIGELDIFLREKNIDKSLFVREAITHHMLLLKGAEPTTFPTQYDESISRRDSIIRSLVLDYQELSRSIKALRWDIEATITGINQDGELRKLIA